MAEPTVLTPIELTDVELDAVSGGAGNVGISVHVSNRTRQSVHQRISETGGSVNIGGGRPDPVASSGTVTFHETFSASQNATNTNSSSQHTTNSGGVTGNAG